MPVRSCYTTSDPHNLAAKSDVLFLITWVGQMACLLALRGSLRWVAPWVAGQVPITLTPGGWLWLVAPPHGGSSSSRSDHFSSLRAGGRVSQASCQAGEGSSCRSSRAQP